MYKLIALLKNGSQITAAEAETYNGIDKKSTELEVQMMDPTSARLVFRDGGRTVVAKEVAATWVEFEGDEDE